MQTTDLASLLCSRLCHDLVGPVGAVASGVEMLELEDDADMRAEAIRLVGLSASQAIARLRFYRLAFGSAGGADSPMLVGEARKVAQGFLAEGRIELDWSETAVPQLPKPAMRLALNLLLVAADALPRGGRLAVRAAPVANGIALTAIADGLSATLADPVRGALAGEPDDEPGPKAGPALLARELAAGLGGRLEVETQVGQVELAARLPALTAT